MSFRTLCRHALDPRLSPACRYIALRGAVTSYTWLTRTSFQSLYTAFEQHCGLIEGAPNEASVIAAAAMMLDEARDRVLLQLRAVAARRRAHKRCSPRPPGPCFQVELQAAIVLGTPRPRRPAWVPDPP